MSLREHKISGSIRVKLKILLLFYSHKARLCIYVYIDWQLTGANSYKCNKPKRTNLSVFSRMVFIEKLLFEGFSGGRA